MLKEVRSTPASQVPVEPSYCIPEREVISVGRVSKDEYPLGKTAGQRLMRTCLVPLLWTGISIMAALKLNTSAGLLDLLKWAMPVDIGMVAVIFAGYGAIATIKRHDFRYVASISSPLFATQLIRMATAYVMTIITHSAGTPSEGTAYSWVVAIMLAFYLASFCIVVFHFWIIYEALLDAVDRES